MGKLPNFTEPQFILLQNRNLKKSTESFGDDVEKGNSFVLLVGLQTTVEKSMEFLQTFKNKNTQRSSNCILGYITQKIEEY